MSRPLAFLFLCVLAMTLVIGCSDDDDGGSPTDGGSAITVSGTVHKGAVNASTVNVYAVTAAGEIGTMVGGW